MKATDSQKFMSALQASVHNVFGLTFDQIKGKTRLGEIVLVRQLVMGILREHTMLSLVSIGQIVNRNHATVIHAMRRHNNRHNTKADLKYAEAYRTLMADLSPKLDMYAAADTPELRLCFVGYEIDQLWKLYELCKQVGDEINMELIEIHIKATQERMRVIDSFMCVN